MSDFDTIAITKENIEEYIQDRAPYLFVDKAKVIKGKNAVGERFFPADEWFFKLHFPNNPVVPAAFQIEAITQTAGLAVQVMKDELKTNTLYIKKIFNIELFEPVKPNDTLFMQTEITSFRRGILKGFGRAYTKKDEEETQHCKLEFQMVMPEIIKACAPNFKRNEEI